MRRAELLGLLLLMGLALLLGAWLRGGRELAGAEQTEQLRALLQAQGPLQMISSEHCGYCTQARQWLSAQQLPFEECFVERDADCRRRWQQVGAQATPSFVVDGKPVLGLDVARLIELLQAR